MSAAVLAAALSGLGAGLLLTPAGGRLRGLRSSGAAGRSRSPGGRRVPVQGLRIAAAGVVLVPIGVLAGARVVVPAGALVVLAGAAGWLRSRAARRAAAVARRRRVMEACAVLAADLRAGQVPEQALHGAAGACADLAPAVAAARLGGDVAAALDRSAAVAGAEGLRAVGAAWRVAEHSGAAFATIAERVAESLRADDAIRRQVSAGLAGTRATARLLALLPLAGTGLGQAVGARPVAFLTEAPLGWGCLGLGLALAVGGLAWVERLADGGEVDGRAAA